MIKIPITLRSDEKGYLDRECPNEDCEYTFKINMEDWENKVSDGEMHCPLCGHIDASDQWNTPQQVKEIEAIVASWAMSYAQEEINKSFKKLERSTRNSKYLRVEYKPGKKISFVNNPIGQSEEWTTDITCEKCGTRYSVIGAAYFCPCCGYNSAVDVFNESLDSIKKMLDSLRELKELYTDKYDSDKADTLCRSMLEGSIDNMVSAFQKFASCRYDELTGEKSRVNDFQIVEKGSKLFKEKTGKGYQEWLSNEEISFMNLMFQKRHLIEHNNGMVDQHYIDKSGDRAYVVGQRIVVKEKDTYTLLGIIKKLSDGLRSA